MPKRTDKTSPDEVPVPRKPLSKRNRTAKKKNILSAADTAALGEFCAQVHVEEFEFNEWSAAHLDLDLTVHAFVSAIEAAQGGSVLVNFSRTVTSATPEGKQTSSREKVSHRLEIPNSLNEGARFVVPGLGDCDGGRSGSLHIIIKIRRSF